MNKNILTVIVPNYNNALYLKECLQSIINSSLKEIELIVVDDGSTDNSLEVIEEIKNNTNPNLKIIKQKNSGLGAARNSGLLAANTKYVCFVDADDKIDKNMLSEMIVLAEANSLEFISCDQVYWNPDKSIAKHIKRPIPEKIMNASTYTSFEPTMSACDKIYNLSFLRSIDFKFTEGRFAEDVLAISYLLCRSNNISHISKGFYFYRRNNLNSITKKRDINHLKKIFNDKIYVANEINNIKNIYCTDPTVNSLLQQRIISNMLSPFFLKKSPISFKIFFIKNIFKIKNLKLLKENFSLENALKSIRVKYKFGF